MEPEHAPKHAGGENGEKIVGNKTREEIFTVQHGSDNGLWDGWSWIPMCFESLNISVSSLFSDDL